MGTVGVKAAQHFSSALRPASEYFMHSSAVTECGVRDWLMAERARIAFTRGHNERLPRTDA